MSRACEGEDYYNEHEDECRKYFRKQQDEIDRKQGFNEYLDDINIIDADPITKITKNPMFPMIALGGLALAGLVYFKVIKI